MTLRLVPFVPDVVGRLAHLALSDRSVGANFSAEFGHYARIVNPIVENAADPDSSEDREIGTIDYRTAAELVRILGAHSSTPDDCYFLVWDGYAGFRAEFLPAAVATVWPSREMRVLGGALGDALETFIDDELRIAQWWIPADGAWTIGNDIYGNSVYFAGSREAVADILGSSLLETERVDRETIMIGEEFE